MSKEKGKIERKRNGWQEKYGGQFLYLNIVFSVVSIPCGSIIDADGDSRIFHAAKKGVAAYAATPSVFWRALQGSNERI
jgi:hypothetical protein